ncbi:MAG: hypothetical protein M3R72_03555 [Bacteroidota bacterium]|nr:hypothetical protein [Bacteroidota bacterium]
MKKILVILTIVASFYTATSYAKPATPTVVAQALQTQFTDAKNISWSEVNNLYKAQFDLNDQTLVAYFNGEGKWVASARNVTALQLPILLQTNLKNSYASYDVLSVMEVDNEDGVTYYVTAENGKKMVQLKSSDYGSWNKYEKAEL